MKILEGRGCTSLFSQNLLLLNLHMIVLHEIILACLRTKEEGLEGTKIPNPSKN
jgi:hypothetical protein